MRDYLSPARAYLGRARAQVVSLSKVTLKPRYVAMFASTAAVAFFATSVVALRAMNNDSSHDTIMTTETVVPGSTSVTKIGNPQPSVDPGVTSTESSSTQTTSGNTSNTQTSITVNNQPIDVPENGSVHKTITSNGNTTQVDVSVNSNGGSSNSSSSSSFIQMNTNTSSQSMNIHSP